MFHRLQLPFLLAVSWLPCIYTADLCQTPKGQKGKCISLNQCEPLYSDFQRSFLTPETETYLRTSHCGFTNGSPKFCCLDESSAPDSDTLIATSDLLPANCGVGTQSKILGGEEADLDEFPWMALLQFQLEEDGPKSFLCGGTLVSRRYVLTAAHCLLPSLISVHLGEYDTETEIDCVNTTFGVDCAPKTIVVGIEERIIYESYRRKDTNRYHDIGLIRLDRDVEFTDFVKPICLPLKVSELYESYSNQELTVAGWGITETTMTSNKLLKLRVPVTDLSPCERSYRNPEVFSKLTRNLTLHAGQICAGGVKDKGSCASDSGGPLMTVKKGKRVSRSYIVGVVSFGSWPCGLADVPGVYTKVAKYVKWIVEKLKP